MTTQDPETTGFLLRWYHYLEAAIAAAFGFMALRVLGHHSEISALRAEMRTVQQDVREIRNHLLGDK